MKDFLKRFYPFILLAIIIFLIYQFRLLQYFNLDSLMEAKDFFVNNRFLAFFILCGLYFIASILFLPTAYISIFVGMIFGPFFGGVISYIGSILAFTISFLESRYLLKNFFSKLRNKIKILNSVSIKLEKNGKIFILFSRLFFLVPYNSLNIVCGVSAIKFRDYMIFSIIGSSIQAFFYAYVGYQFMKFTDPGQIRMEAIKLIGVVMIFIVFIFIFKKIIEKKNLINDCED